MAVDACDGIDDCLVAYLQGNPALPLDNTRTTAVVDGIDAANIKVISSYQGGYTVDSGREVGQDLLLAEPDVDVIIGSSQALLGVQSILPEGSDIKLIGNGSSTQAIDAVQAGEWFGTYVVPEKTAAALAAEVGIGAARGEDEPTSINTGLEDFSIRIGIGSALDGIEGEYSD
jgi:ribose transport system substrate-binding protein